MQRMVYLKDRFCIKFFRPRADPRTFLQCFALYTLCSKAKHCRNVLGLSRKVVADVFFFQIALRKRE